jgi:site-specific DNA recombinase
MQNFKNAFDIFTVSKRFKTVAEHLNAEGHRTENGAMYTGQSVARILRDVSHLQNGTIPQELWDKVQVILGAKERDGDAKRRVAHLCSGLLRCGCGQAMYVPTNSKKYTCQKCRNKIAKDDLEVIVLENLKSTGNKKITSMTDKWQSHSFEEKREIIESTVKEIVAEDKKVTLTLFAFG